MLNAFAVTLPHLTLASHIVLAFIFIVLAFGKHFDAKIVPWLGEHALRLGLLVSVAAFLGSLLYSTGLGFEPCVLCWWQRVFLFPLVPLFLVAWWKGDRTVFQYAVPLALLAGIIALYQSYTLMGGISLLECTSAEGACSRLYVQEFGYITIPVMSLTVSLYILALAWAKKIYENSHT